MVNPSMSTIVKGPQEVLRWCQLNLARCDHSRQRNIVIAVQDVLELVRRLKVSGCNTIEEPHESVFESNVNYNGELHYQFLMPVFWESFIPTIEKFWSQATPDQLKEMITSFPYERWEVEQTLFQFQDAAGKLIHYQKKSKFKKCSCMFNNPKAIQCVFKKLNWNCERPALLLRKNILLESIMVEKRRKRNEEKRINDAVDVAKKIATQYLHSDEGREEVRSAAEKEVKERREDEKAESNALKSDQVKHSIVKDLFVASKKNTNIINLMMECLPWKKEIEKEIQETMKNICNDFIAKEIESRKTTAIETNKKLKTILDAWIGLTIEDVFIAWKNIVFELKIQRIKDENKQQIEKERCDLEEKEKQAMALDELQLWTKKYDHFNDAPFWQHALTNEIRWKEPTVECIVENASWSFPPTESKQPKDTIDMMRNRANNALDKESLVAATNILKRRKEALKKKKEAVQCNSSINP